MSRFLSSEGDNAVRLVNNLDWTAPLSAIDFLRDIGKHYRVGTMLKKDAVSSRLNSDAGISYTEFSYQILQGLDFLELYRQYGCVLQTGGSDQWGNLTSGTDLIHRVEGAHVHAIGTPLITNSDGTKFGKSEGNAIWLDPEMCSPYRFYQFWLNTDDADVIDAAQGLHVPRAARASRSSRSSSSASRSGARRSRCSRTRSRRSCTGRMPRPRSSRHRRRCSARAISPRSTPTPSRRRSASCRTRRRRRMRPIAQLLVDTGLVASLSEARRAIAQGGVSLDNVRIDDEAATIEDRVPPGGMAVLRRGKKTLAGVFVR